MVLDLSSMANQTIKLGGGLRQVLFFFLVCYVVCSSLTGYFIHYPLVWFIMNCLVDFANGKESGIKTAYLVTGLTQRDDF